jgi:SAM-dependent methyltransferase
MRLKTGDLYMKQELTPTTIDALMARYKKAIGSSTLTREEAEKLYWYFHPRFRFLKTVASGAKLLDVGANQGGLSQWRGWNEPQRNDIKMYGVDLARGNLADNYAGWESGNLDESLPKFDRVKFDAILCSHLIEHIQRPNELINWLGTRTNTAARLYLEWPNTTSLDLPKRGDLAAAGWPVMISNFHDDDTHRDLPTLEMIAQIVEDAGFLIVERGVIDAGYLTDQLIDLGRKLDDPTLTLQGFWSLTHWSTYLVAIRR